MSGLLSWPAHDGDLRAVAVVLLDELARLDEHPAGAAARVVDSALVGLYELGYELDDAGGRVELAVFLRAACGEDLQEVLVYAANEVFLVEALLADLVDRVDERLDGANLRPKRGEQAERQRTLEGGVHALRLGHGVVDFHGNVVRACVVNEVGPAGFLRKVVDVRRIVETGVLKHLRWELVEAVLLLQDGGQLTPPCVELVAGELEEHEAYDRVSVLLETANPTQRDAAVPESIFQRELFLLCFCLCHI